MKQSIAFTEPGSIASGEDGIWIIILERVEDDSDQGMRPTWREDSLFLPMVHVEQVASEIKQLVRKK